MDSIEEARTPAIISRPSFVPAVVFLVVWSLTTHGKYSVSGDEPHYLIVSQSLLADGDLDLRNNHESNEGRRFGSSGLQPGPHARENRHGKLFPVHDIGVPIILLPVYAVATAVGQVASEAVLERFRMNRGLFAYSLISLFLIALTACAAALTRAALIADGSSAGIASAVVLALWLSPPVLSNAFLVFPEVFALLATAWVIRLSTRAELNPAAIFGTALVLGVLPWLHRKYALYAVALAFVLAWRQRASMMRLLRRDHAIALIVFVAPGAALAVWTWHQWGNLGGPLTAERPPFSWGAFQAGWLGLLIDRENGLFVWGPVHLLLPAAWALTWRRSGAWLLPAAALFLPSAAHDQWWGGFSPAARFLVPLAPVFALPLAGAVRLAGFRTIFLLLLIPQALISAYGWQHPRALWPQGDGTNRVLGALGGTDAMLPSIRTEMNLRAGGIALALILVANAAAWRAFHARIATDPTPP